MNYGAPNLNILNRKNNTLLKNYIDELLEKKVIKIDDSELVFLDEESNFGILINRSFHVALTIFHYFL